MGRNMDIEIPADAKTVTLELEKRCSFTLRTLLPQVKDRVELMIEDYFYGGDHELGADVYRLEADNGEKLQYGTHLHHIHGKGTSPGIRL